MSDTPRDPSTERLDAREKFSYGLGDLASCLYWTSISNYLLFFYTDIFGITAIFAGLRSTDVARRRVRGNHHGHPLSPGERSGQDIAGDYAREWLAERFAPVAMQVG